MIIGQWFYEKIWKLNILSEPKMFVRSTEPINEENIYKYFILNPKIYQMKIFIKKTERWRNSIND